MPKPLPEREIAVTVNYRGWITILNVMGPIVHPVTVTEKKALQMVMMGLEVVEHVKTTGQTIKLTLENIRDPHRYATLNTTTVNVLKKPGVPIKKANPEPTVTTPVQAPVIPSVKEENPAPEVVPEPPVQTTIDPEVKDETSVAAEPAAPAEEPVGLLAKDYVFQYNKNGSVNETVIPWQEFSKNQRRLLRDRINEINEASNMPKM